MRSFINYIRIVLVIFFCEICPVSAHESGFEKMPNHVLIEHLGPQDSALHAMLIVPRALDVQSDFKLHKGEFLMEFQVNREIFDQIAFFLQKQKNGWGICDPLKDSRQVGTFSIDWDSTAGNGNICVVRNDAVKLFREIIKISASTDNKALNTFMSGALDSVR